MYCGSIICYRISQNKNVQCYITVQDKNRDKTYKPSSIIILLNVISYKDTKI